ncbi:ABC transporter substrate-binding protein [Caldanaerobius polysaccharolyticus]|uniref:ABC transporter substrate-binding protein n=1 Tax=Caldanaerobius polysaccharolyticus TaxID=44256 RepID=UPI00047D437D|nr:ABC transporter substrate-binding protein [Caldanaerobius polysaccharolyticus]
MKKLFSFLLIFVFVISLIGCGSNKTSNSSKANSTKTDSVSSGEKVKVIVWGLNPMAVGSGNKEMIDAFNKTHPNIQIVPQSTPGTGGYATQDVTKLLSAIASGSPPDVTWLDRFTAAQFAARNALTPLDEYIKASDLDMSQYAKYTVDEVTFNGNIWALPWDTDTRILFWNKDLFKKAGLDPDRPPQDWDELLDYSKKLTITDNKGNFKQIGFIPNFGNSWLYLFGFQNGGKFLSDDGRTALLNSPEIVQALEFMVKGYDILGGAKKINAYASTFQSEANDPFLTGQVAMLITVNNAISSYARYKPDLNYGAALPPAPKGKQKITWSGGWSWAIPRGAKHPKEAFEVIKWLTTEGIKEQAAGAAAFNKSQGRKYYVPFPAAYLPANEELIKTYVDPIDNPSIKNAIKVGMDAMSVSRARPVSPVGETLWTEHSRAIDKAIYHEMGAKEALDAANQNVQKELDKFWSSFNK